MIAFSFHHLKENTETEEIIKVHQTAICIKIKELEPLYKSTNMFTREADGRSLQPQEEAVVE